MSIAQMSGDNRKARTIDPVLSETPCSCAAIRRAARHVTRFYDRALKPAGLKLTQYSVLANLARAGGMTITALADRLAMDRTTLTRNLGPLERAGWIVVRAGRDRRSRAVEITAEGRRLHDRALPLWQAAERSFRETMGRDRSAALRDLLDAATKVSGR